MSEFESPKLKTAGKLKSIECTRGEKMKMKARIWRIKDLEAMAIVPRELAAFTFNLTTNQTTCKPFYILQ